MVDKNYTIVKNQCRLAGAINITYNRNKLKHISGLKIFNHEKNHPDYYVVVHSTAYCFNFTGKIRKDNRGGENA